jgi:hypothetical protein
MLGLDKKEKPMENGFHSCNYSNYIIAYRKAVNIDKHWYFVF